MSGNRRILGALAGVVLVVVLGDPPASEVAAAGEISEHLAINGVIVGAYQHEYLDAPPDGGNRGGGAVPFQMEIDYTPTERDRIFVKFGFASGNGLTDHTAFRLPPWAADLEADVVDINGRDRAYLLNAWYMYSLAFAGNQMLRLSGGIIDATDYLDQNAYANDEYTQFMNSALVNGPNSFAPSYDIGGAIEWTIARFHVDLLAMEVGENDAGHPFTFVGAQLWYRLDTGLGEGNYRLVFQGTDRTAKDVESDESRARSLAIVSLDQQLGSVLGAWARLGWANQSSATEYAGVYSGGLDVSGSLWGRDADNLGIGLGRLEGGNLDVDQTKVFEVYARFALSEIIAVTGDYQYMKDTLREGEGPAGSILGIRLTAIF